MPKSRILTLLPFAPAGSSQMFSGFRSRCRTPSRCASSIVAQVWLRIAIASLSGMGRRSFSLSAEALDEFAVAGQLRRDDFNGHAPAGAHMSRAIDSAHSPSSAERFYLVL